jgi:aminopeptidase YwaD
MLDELIPAIRKQVSGERALEAVRGIARFHRIQASPGYDAAAEWLIARLEAAGLRTEVMRVAGDGRTRYLGYLMPQGWACDRAIARLHGDGSERTLCDFSAEPLSLIQRSAPAHGRFPILKLNDGTESAHYDAIDVRGRVVLTSGDVHRVHELAVIERGAAGLISYGRRLAHPVRDENTDPESIAYTSFWWGEHEARGWGVVVSPLEARRLIALLRDGRQLELEVAIETRAFDTTIPLVSTVLPATSPDANAEVLIVSHLCHPFPGANDNASGAAANLETAIALVELDREGALPPRRRAIRHLWMPEFTGTYAWLATRAGVDRPGADIVAALNLDMVGEDQKQCGSTFLIEQAPAFAASYAESLIALIRDRSVDWVLSYSGPGHVPIPRLAEVPFSGGSDHAVLGHPAIGVPCPMLIQWPDRFYHSSYDTPDRCDPESLALAARCAAAYAAFVASAGEQEIGWLATQIGRRARIRMLAALESGDDEVRVAHEFDRGHWALLSLPQLACTRREDAAAHATAATRTLSEAATHVAQGEIDALRSFMVHETGVTPKAIAPSGQPRVPLRALRAPLHYQRWLIEGWNSLPVAIRDRWRALETGPENFAPLFELAWCACDGARTLSLIARRVREESGREAEAEISEFFTWTAALGLSTWKEPKET